MPTFQILVVDDDENVCSMVSEVMQEAGFEVLSSGTAQEARQRFEKSSFDLVLLDRVLPDADGLDLCAELRRKPALRAVPILFLTAKGTVQDKVDGLRIGGDDYLTKPFNPAELLARVEALLRRSGRLGKLFPRRFAERTGFRPGRASRQHKS